mmetsp:Transcript_21771/g.61820  ORF Transcript_21771/g.61820 Transcript_21771/m.61820 type:complete len:256 (-) Transcript_21771:893-1660(-)
MQGRVHDGVLEGLEVLNARGRESTISRPTSSGMDGLQQHAHHLHMASVRCDVQCRPAPAHGEHEAVPHWPVVAKDPEVHARALAQQPLADVDVAFGSGKEERRVPIDVKYVDVQADCCAMAQFSDCRPQRNAAAAVAGGEDVRRGVAVPLHGRGRDPPEEEQVHHLGNDRNEVHSPMHLPVAPQLLPEALDAQEREQRQGGQLQEVLGREAPSGSRGSPPLDRGVQEKEDVCKDAGEADEKPHQGVLLNAANESD